MSADNFTGVWFDGEHWLVKANMSASEDYDTREQLNKAFKNAYKTTSREKALMFAHDIGVRELHTPRDPRTTCHGNDPCESCRTRGFHEEPKREFDGIVGRWKKVRCEASLGAQERLRCVREAGHDGDHRTGDPVKSAVGEPRLWLEPKGCTSIFEWAPNKIVRCKRLAGHEGSHECSGYVWDRDDEMRRSDDVQDDANEGMKLCGYSWPGLEPLIPGTPRPAYRCTLPVGHPGRHEMYKDRQGCVHRPAERTLIAWYDAPTHDAGEPKMPKLAAETDATLRAAISAVTDIDTRKVLVDLRDQLARRAQELLQTVQARQEAGARQEAEPKVKRQPVTYLWSKLNWDFLKLLAEIAYYAEDKYGSAEQYMNARLTGQADPINHAYEHLRQYQAGEPHDKFGDKKYHLAAAAYNLMMAAAAEDRWGFIPNPVMAETRKKDP